MARWGLRHRFELTRLEVAGALVSAAVALLVVFLLGVYAGSGLGGRQLAGDGQAVTLPVLSESEEPTGRDEPTIDDAVGGGSQLAAAPKPPSEESIPPAPAGHAEQGARSTSAASPPAPGTGEERVRPVAPSKPSVALAIERPVAVQPESSDGGSWSVQVTASRDPRTADAMLRRLRSKGYDAYVVRVRRQGETFYRVRVGRYRSMEQAHQMVTRLRREREVPEAFVASD